MGLSMLPPALLVLLGGDHVLLGFHAAEGNQPEMTGDLSPGNDLFQEEPCSAALAIPCWQSEGFPCLERVGLALEDSYCAEQWSVAVCFFSAGMNPVNRFAH